MNLLQFIMILIQVESGFDPQAVGDGGKAVGVLQIHKVMVDDVNRIVKHRKFSYADRYSPEKSIQMAVIYFRHYEKDLQDHEALARAWNGGPSWRKKKHKTDAYATKVMELIQRRE